MKELGGDQYLSKYDTGTLAKRLSNTPEADGDGQKYRGRGLIQVTGRDNYFACSKALFGDDRLLRTPELLEQAEWACKSAAWFWNSRNLDALADSGSFEMITGRINGGLNGYAERLTSYSTALKVLA
ncbi:glycoside hydrolase family 19 protein [Pseudomonas veronii]|uniref:Glycoside hydrolase family 19 protein n=2 Tax=Pseudomonas fluorescens group TaxID=136843 RepID=A0A8I1JFM7_9PSED|nr:glycoside hydrolase family 19 protein [Pseudomonas veronii]MBI6600183.1 glycoside hydrolase family 19 protein [Pseudomonas sp. S4_EA_1b]MBI6624651.1 glycoside hydrolase family 19 protein [Pseudomonas rhodesiae]MBI6653348.1 glycoside hydrolase family 19 protein [Pseudomonas veronii]